MSQSINMAVCSREETAQHAEGDFSHVVSLLDPERGYDGIVLPRKCRFTEVIMCHDLDDIEVRAPKYHDCIAPTEKHVVQVLRSFESLGSLSGPGILVHCEAGVSRSTAGAILGLCALGMEPKDAFQTISQINELGLPNRRMLRIGGKLLGDQGELVELAEAQRKYLFNKYGQQDPVELLREELQNKGRLHLLIEYICLYLRTTGGVLRFGSDEKMLSRWKIKAMMAQWANRKHRREGEEP